MAKSSPKKKWPFDPYELYLKAVQSPDTDAKYFRKLYRSLRGRDPKTLREDFCGTAALCSEWVKLDPRLQAVGVDLDPEPLDYGRQMILSKLKADQQQRVRLLKKNVLSKDLPRADVSVALNFSYFLFKTRPMMREYFRNLHRGLNPKGIAVLDVFGGSQCQDAIEDKARHKGFTYYWEQMGFDPVSNEAQFHIHFGYRGRKYRRVFSYDWRMWTLPELQEILLEAGFRRVTVHWEGTAKDGSGNGVFRPVTKGEACLSWIAYLVAEK